MAKDIPQNPKRNAKGIRQNPKKNAKGISKNSKKNARGIPQNPKGNDEKYRQEFITRLRKSGATQKEMADARGWTEGMISKMLHGKIPPQLDDFLQAFAPFLIRAGGITAPATVVKMAAYLGGTVEDGDMAEVIRTAERYCRVPTERTRVEEFRKRVASAKKVRTPTPASASAVATTEAQPRAANGALARQCLNELVQHILGQCRLQPAVCGYQFPLSAAIERTLTVEPTAGEASAPISLDALRHPRQTLGLLAGVPGSGHTVFLLQLAYAWASSWSNSQPTPIAIYVDAPAFLEYAGHRRDIFHFWAAQVFPDSEDKASALRDALRTSDESGMVLWLVDKFDRLTDAQQGEVIAHLVSSAALYTAYPWQIPALAARLRLSPSQIFWLPDLTPEQQRQALTQLAEAQPERGFDLSLGLYALDELPDLARLPIGLMSIYACIAQHASAPTQIVESAIQEYFRRANQECSFGGAWIALAPAVKSLLHAGAICLADSTAWGDSYMLIESRYEETIDPAWACKWDYLTRSGLLEVHHVETSQGETVGLRFWNRDILAYCAAYPSPASWWNRAGSIHLSMKGTADQANRFAEVLHKQTKKIAA